MKLSIDTYKLREKFGDKQAVQMIKNAGFDCLDYSFYWFSENEQELILGENYIEYAKDLRKYIDEIGITCNQAHAPFEMKPDDTIDMTNTKFVRVVRSIESASILGAQNIVIHALRAPYETTFDLNLKYFKTLEPYAKKAGIHIAVENLYRADEPNYSFKNGRIWHESLFGTPQEINFLLDNLSDTFTLCIDVGHAALTRNAPDDFIRNVHTHRLKALHIQDMDYKGDRHFLPYTGLLEWDKIAEALAHVKYDGDLTLEVFSYLNAFDEELMPVALKFAENIGRHIINKIKANQ